MAGIYIHIPFCKKKCHYCNFFSLATTRYRPEFLESLLLEIEQRRNYLPSPKINSIYLGGGTPSLYSASDLNRIFEKLEEVFDINSSAEITLEANPDDLSAEYLKSLKSTSINRLSIGVQSFFDEELISVNRVHSGREAIESVKLAQDNGFNNLSLDLIYGIPASTIESWEENLNILQQLQPTHLSAYSLTQEPQTAYDVLVKKGKLQAPNDEKAIQQYEMLQNFLPQVSMEQYEISNYAKDGKYAQHNTSYWQGVPYIGLGPSAHSYNGTSRRWNKAHLSDYIKSSENEGVSFDEEQLSLSNQWNEWVMTGLRTKWGVNLDASPKEFPKEWYDLFQLKAQGIIQQEWLQEQYGVFKLTKKGKFFADGIAAEFFVE
ncbi:radical SAM family heme chaperone HemW [Lentimicrobium sp. S6]|uniref:radical SAM family heme chaperone HemW n=1 Tax=Lentimicrobium sp. S6 TaxID=2735872 RepID=UPI00155452CF|nr:radical SAM family heme chaperone HemW [Lentimicrobium sp. S6]NPD44109.1 radical SAM family heme chaperone HemW [Lentimicrobium sp. S6]